MMGRKQKSTKRAAKGYVIGRAGFAKISAVEGISIEKVDAYCQNCGYESHCGASLQKPLRSYRRELLDKDDVIICNRCRCVKCTESDPGPVGQLFRKK